MCSRPEQRQRRRAPPTTDAADAASGLRRAAHHEHRQRPPQYGGEPARPNQPTTARDGGGDERPDRPAGVDSHRADHDDRERQHARRDHRRWRVGLPGCVDRGPSPRPAQATRRPAPPSARSSRTDRRRAPWPAVSTRRRSPRPAVASRRAARRRARSGARGAGGGCRAPGHSDRQRFGRRLPARASDAASRLGRGLGDARAGGGLRSAMGVSLSAGGPSVSCATLVTLHLGRPRHERVNRDQELDRYRVLALERDQGLVAAEPAGDLADGADHGPRRGPFRPSTATPIVSGDRSSARAAPERSLEVPASARATPGSPAAASRRLRRRMSSSCTNVSPRFAARSDRRGRREPRRAAAHERRTTIQARRATPTAPVGVPRAGCPRSGRARRPCAYSRTTMWARRSRTVQSAHGWARRTGRARGVASGRVRSGRLHAATLVVRRLLPHDRDARSARSSGGDGTCRPPSDRRPGARPARSGGCR